MPPVVSGPFSRIANQVASTHGEQYSGFLLLDDNRSGLEWRLRMIDSARQSIDLQYYLWYGDDSGRLIAYRLIAAADRGVRVRLLVDDLNTLLENSGRVSQRDTVAARLNSHPNVELRLFNPWSRRAIGGRVGESLLEAGRVNQRMHNKALIVDNMAVVLGGRNLGDEYMGLNPHFNFRDLDVLGVGPVAAQASGVFDEFWNSEWVLPASALDIPVTANDTAEARANMLSDLRQAQELSEIPIAPADWSTELAQLSSDVLPGIARVTSDRPRGKTLEHVMLEETRRAIRTARTELRVVNAYIIPNDQTIKTLQGLDSHGVSIDVLTNSLASHDVPAVNSHYKPWRKRMLEAGVNLYELRHDGSTQQTVADTPPVRSRFMGLHTKAMTIDDRTVYIGSMNYDPRSAVINSEMGVFIDSPPLAEVVNTLIDRDIQPDNSWEVSLDAEGKLIWNNSVDSVTRQPARSVWQRIQDVFFMLFPKELY
ncbi:phospholipase D family protein [Parahaliea maris]|uniref:Phospholipase D family protein n=1 Tax=Parahaliea maris TaxID=2716870 RepID=A0A5C9A8T3_9GAMM|nr:phospholipase D family protein [Parahaliea maris]TXS95977.1 phospholipase D family protein [Parahaliea maris]